MTTATLSAAQVTRISLDTAPGLPKLPHIPESWDILLTPQQQEENLLHVALWIVERDLENFDMVTWHRECEIKNGPMSLRGEEGLNECGTVHCIAGFAQVMAGVKGFSINPESAGHRLLGFEAFSHFMDNNEDGLAFLKEVIARNS
jgi:hypothetical protein